MERAVLLLGALILLCSTQARADEIDECIQSNAAVQRLRLQGKLMDAHEQAIVCSRPGCPTQIQQDCSSWLSELEKRIPSVVFEARLGRDERASDVRVFVDGKRVATSLDGKAVRIDPGSHSFRFERTGRSITRTIVILEGEKARRIAVEFPAPPATKGRSPDTDEETSRPVPAMVFVFSALGVMGGAGFAYFGLSARSRENELRADNCSPRCSKDETDAIEREYIYADVSLGVGVLSVGAASYFFFTRPKVRRETVHITPAPISIAGGAGAGIRGVF
jgi:hypothetical protein